MNLQLLTYVSKIVSLDLTQREIVVERRAEGGVQVLRTATPCLITMLEGTNQMRFGTMPDMFRAARYPVKHWDRMAAGIEDVTKIGLKGSPTVVNKVFTPSPRAEKAEMVTVENGSSADLAVELLSRMAVRFPVVEKELAQRAL